VLLTASWIKQLEQYERLFVGFGGGLDPTVLLHNLAVQPELLSKLVAIHINHGLSKHALNWQEQCLEFSNALGIPIIIKEVAFEREANVEERARKARYTVFSNLVGEKDCLILAHHLDDQAETLLLQLFRGAGIDGLAAMSAETDFKKSKLLRPLLSCSRQSIKAYAKAHTLKWVDDESNLDLAFSRNYLRHAILPLVQARWPAVVNNLARTAAHCQQAQQNLDALAKIDSSDLKSVSLPLSSLDNLDPARLTNLLRCWLRSNKVILPDTSTFNRLIREVIQAKDDAKPEVRWKGFVIKRYQQTLYLLKVESEPNPKPKIWSNFPEPLGVEGLGTLVAKQVDQGFVLPEEGLIELRFRQGGELFHWHGQRKQLKKLMQEWQIPPWLRDRIPLLYVDGQLALVVGYAISDLFTSIQGGYHVRINL
jgi:tRNA(Ile)-lysidine synthase